MRFRYFVYILTKTNNTVLYTGMTNDFEKRILQHKEKNNIGFTSRYNISKLVYFEILDTPEAAIKREKQIKAGSRNKKIELIKSINPIWRDLSDDFN